MTLEEAAQWANVVMAGAALIGLAAVVLWKRQPRWEHGRDVASEGYEAVAAVEHAMANCIAAYSAAKEQLRDKKRDDDDDAEAFAGARDSMLEILGNLREKGVAMYEASAKVRAVWGIDAFTPFLMYKVLVDGLDQAYVELTMQLTTGQPLPDHGLRSAHAIPWNCYLENREPEHGEVSAVIETLSDAIRAWAQSAGVPAGFSNGGSRLP